MADTSLRYLETLLAIPRYPRKTTAAEVHKRLAAAGFTIDKRSVERDLNRLSERFAIASDEGSRPTGWFWRADSVGLAAPGTTTSEALELDLLARYLKPILPASSWATLAPRLAAARATLNTIASAPLARWRSRVAVVDDGQPLLAPKVAVDVQDAVHDALLRKKRIELDYLAAESTTPKRYEVHPIALVYQGRVGYLVATLFDYTNLLQLALHRMSKPVVQEKAARDAPGFDLQAYLQQQLNFGFPSGREWRIELRVSDWMARHLSERRLSEDQKISRFEGEEGCLVRATVPESESLVWWLRSHGNAVEVLKPVALRRRLAEEFERLSVAYNKRRGKRVSDWIA